MKLIGIDIGTSSVKALAIDERGKVLAQASAPVPVSTPQPGWSEQNPEDWWIATQICLAQIGIEDATAIGLAGQMHGSVFLDENGDVIRPALLWNDQRTQKQCDWITATVGKEKYQEITGNPCLTGFQVPKIIWLRDNEPENFAQLSKILLPKDYIRYKLTGEFATDVSDASGTGLLDRKMRNWSPELFAALELNPELFPEVFESNQITSRTEIGVPVAAGAGDQAGAAIGTGIIEPGDVSISLGTSGVVFSASGVDQIDPTGIAHCFCHANHSWHVMGVMLSCGGSVQWASDTFFGKDSLARFSQLASESDAKGITFLPYLSGERCPVANSSLRGSFHGLSLASDPASIARAVFEGVSMGLKQCMDKIEGVVGSPKNVVVTGGGVQSTIWLEILSTILNRPLKLLECDEGPAFGAAILAGVGVGIWSDLGTAIVSCVRARDVIEPGNWDFNESFTRFEQLASLAIAQEK